MAHASLTPIEQLAQDQITCGICLDMFTEARMLKCSHSFCTKCLLKMLRNKPKDKSVRCPLDRQKTVLPKNGVKGLPLDFRGQQMADAMKADAKQTPCHRHRSQKLTLVCTVCEQLTCVRCQTALHSDHNCVPIKEFVLSERRRKSEGLEPILAAYKEALERLEAESRVESQKYSALLESFEMRKQEAIAALEQKEQDVRRRVRNNKGVILEELQKRTRPLRAKIERATSQLASVHDEQWDQNTEVQKYEALKSWKPETPTVAEHVARISRTILEPIEAILLWPGKDCHFSALIQESLLQPPLLL